VVERFNRTLKNDIWKMLYTQWQLQMGRRTAASRVRLQRAQASHHRPADVTLAIAERLLDTVYNAIKIMGPAKFKAGNSICVSKYKTIFEKGYMPNWTIEVFTFVKAAYQFRNLFTRLSGKICRWNVLRTSCSSGRVSRGESTAQEGRQSVRQVAGIRSHNSWIHKNNVI